MPLQKQEVVTTVMDVIREMEVPLPEAKDADPANCSRC
jgi:hypothetical protein